MNALLFGYGKIGKIFFLDFNKNSTYPYALKYVEYGNQK